MKNDSFFKSIRQQFAGFFTLKKGKKAILCLYFIII